MLDHLLGDFEVGDHAAAQRADGAQVGGRLAQHQLGIVADRDHLRLAGAIFERNDRRLMNHHARPAQVDHRVGGAEVDGEVPRTEIEDRETHCLPPEKNLVLKRVRVGCGERRGRLAAGLHRFIDNGR